MKCESCGKDVDEKSAEISRGMVFCNNLCRRSFEKSSRNTSSEDKNTFESLKSNLKPLAGDTITEIHKVEYKISVREKIYFIFKLFFTLLAIVIIFFFGYLQYKEGLVKFIPFLSVFFLYAILLFTIIFITKALFIGYIRGNAIKISNKQFPDILEILERQCKQLEIKKIPELYSLQAGGILNAMATRFSGKDYVIIYADILETAYESGPAAVGFVLGHELGHIKQKHILKRFLLLPSSAIPFLEFAYSRACEYTCDNIGKAVSPNGATDGLAILVMGKHLFKRVDINDYSNQISKTGGFSVWLSELFSTHPHTCKRMKNIHN